MIYEEVLLAKARTEGLNFDHGMVTTNHELIFLGQSNGKGTPFTLKIHT